ncbi:MAG: hypothetical protein R3F60_20840 [bacterium]
MKPLVALLSLSALAASPALAAPRWGDFKDNGCVHRDVAPGIRAYSAVLWDVQGSWEEACAQMPGTVKGMQFKHPQVCVNVAPGINPAALVKALVGGVDIHKACEADNIGYDKCLARLSQAGIRELGEYARRPGFAVFVQSLVARWPGPLFGLVAPGAGGTWASQMIAQIEMRGVRQVKQGGGGLNIWGVFSVPDQSCLPPAYHTVKGASWQAAADKCKGMGLKLCKRDQLCQGGKPLAGSPAGDVWVATGDGPNAWVSVGQAQPARVCKDHVEVAGSPPGVGHPERAVPITGQPTMYRCCP